MTGADLHRAFDDQDSARGEASLPLSHARSRSVGDNASALVRSFGLRRIDDSADTRVRDIVAVEEPLEMRLRYWFKEAQLVQSLGLTMRTPGHDRELILGSLLSEGIIRNRRDVVEVRHLGAEPSNEIVAELSKGVDAEAWRLARTSFVNSSCGVCGKRSREAIAQPPSPHAGVSSQVNARTIARLPMLLREQQEGFIKTGGLHAAALATSAGEIIKTFEDVGRHNAFDKLIGWAIEEDLLPLGAQIVILSSRSSFELIQKLAMAGGSVIATVGAPSSLAIETARDYGMTLIGFIRDQSFNVYSGEWRINSR